VFLVHFDTVPTGWVSKISQKSNTFVDFSLTALVGVTKIKKVYAGERIKAEMKSNLFSV
jgi:hypothetical protein